ncbi:YceI family protein [Aquimarina addita]|uniref:YceI family protein n=1 Tax=Aquimarina addita TaxID=870485 RepID=A0ABP6URC6_9FLAO
MKNKFAFITISLLMITSIASYGQKKEIKTSESTINWTGKKVTGEHTGTLKFSKGHLSLNGDTITGGEFVVDMTTLSVTDLETGKGKEKLEGHLTSDDFFGTTNHKSSKLVITKATKQSGDTYKMEGDLTIKGITNPITFDLKVAENSASTTLSIDRTKYNIKYGSGSFFDNLGDKAIYDEFELAINLKM